MRDENHTVSRIVSTFHGSRADFTSQNRRRVWLHSNLYQDVHCYDITSFLNEIPFSESTNILCFNACQT
jgi:hypothetical protein